MGYVFARQTENKEKAVSLVNGGPSQLTWLANEETVDEFQKVISNKRAAATTAAQQAADVSPIFWSMRNMSDCGSSSEIPASVG